MNNRTRLFVIVASTTLAVGVTTAGVASYVGLGGAIGILGSGSSGDLAFIPGTAQFVAYADVRGLMDSNLRHTLQPTVPSAPAGNSSLEQIGLNLETDVDSVVVASMPLAASGVPSDNPPLLIARGRFDAGRIEASIRDAGGSPTQYRGTRLVANEKIGVAFVETGQLVVGRPDAVKMALDTKAGASASVTGNDDVMRLVHHVDDSDTWVVANFQMLQSSRALPTGVAGQLPAITWLAASGKVGDGVAAKVFAEGRDERAAQDLREVVRGFVALARLQTGNQAGFNELLNSIELTGDGNTVTLSFAVPAEFFEHLKGAGRVTLPAEPPASAPAARFRRTPLRPAA